VKRGFFIVFFANIVRKAFTSSMTLPEPRKDIRTLSVEELEEALTSHQEKKFRAQQVNQWLWEKGCTSFDEMSNLPVSTRQFLTCQFTFHTAAPEIQQESRDGTVKTGFRLHDQSLIEGVLIPSGNRFTACISSQAGCQLGCAFCATGKLGFTRNLTAGEIFDQVIFLSRLAGTRKKPENTPGHPLSNIVFMGMGEPFLNYDAVQQAIGKITSKTSLGLSPQRITVSSIGIPEMIRRMAGDDPGYHFALSLHAANDKKRNALIPFNLHHPLATLIEALKYYHQRCGKRITIEYILFAGINDTPTDAADLASFCRNFPVKINLIEYNPVEETGFSGSDDPTIRHFITLLEKRNLVVNLRRSKGRDIQAACGQLSAERKLKIDH